jgi:hypothetical protein
VKLPSFLHNVSQINPHAKLHPALDWQSSIARPQFALHLHGALHGFHHTGELRQQAIPARAHCLAAMLLHQGVHHL